jgi:diguanylate cyclase (GGDEF)-like protein
MGNLIVAAIAGAAFVVVGLVVLVIARLLDHRHVVRDATVARLLTERRREEQDVEIERARLSAELAQSASTDRLTRLLNRAAFTDKLAEALAVRAPQEGEEPVPLTVMLLDIARFRGFNETLGPIVSDQLLIAVSRRIASALRPGDTLGRIDGDVFAALLETVPQSLAGDVAQRVLRSIRPPYDIDGKSLNVAFSCGLASIEADETVDAHEVLRRADVALQNAKLTSHSFVTFEPRIEAETAERRQFDEDLRQALPGQQLFLVYQPLVDTHTGRVTGVEALMRWKHPERGIVSPADFIPVAESSGQIVDMGLWALTEACRQQREWRERNGYDIVVAVNMSARQLSERVVVERVLSIVLREAVEPRKF